MKSFAETRAERNLWRKVILQAVQDLTNTSSDRKASHARDEARAWFRDQGSDFREVCSMAELDPKHVSKTIGAMVDLTEKEPPRTSERKVGPYEYNGETVSIPTLAKRYGVPYQNLQRRIRSGKTIEEALALSIARRCKPSSDPGVGRNFP